MLGVCRHVLGGHDVLSTHDNAADDEVLAHGAVGQGDGVTYVQVVGLGELLLNQAAFQVRGTQGRTFPNDGGIQRHFTIIGVNVQGNVTA